MVSEDKGVIVGATHSFFETESGRRIPIVPGYRALFPHFYWTSPEVLKDQQESQQTYTLFLNHVYKYCAALDLLESVGAPIRWQASLDIGAMDATLGRLFAAEQRVVSADALDQTNLTEKLSDETFNSHLQRFLSESSNARPTAEGRRQFLQTVPLFNEMRYVPPESSAFWHLRNSGDPKINQFIQTDIRAFQTEARYDLVTCFLTIVKMDLDLVFEKISASLSEGGTFVMIEPYWWYPYLFFGVAGEFPWAFQRLSGSDLQAYIEAYHPADKEFLLRRLEDFRHRHTVDTYIAKAEQNGLALLGCRRFIQTEPTGMFRAKLSPQYMNGFKDAKLADVIDDIRSFRSDVQAIDLMTSYVALAFVKRSHSSVLLSEALTGST